MAKEIKKVVEPAYSVSIKIMGKFFYAKGDSVIEALKNLSVGNTKGMAVLTVSKGEQRNEKILNVAQTYRLFAPSRTLREVGLKQVSSLFKL